MKNNTIRFILLLVVLSAASLYQANSQSENEVTDWKPEIKQIEGHKSYFAVALSADERKKMETLWNEIGEDLKTEKNDFAGTYINTAYENGYFLRWSTRKGFILIPYSDESWINDFSHGKVTFIDNSEIIFTPEKELSYGRAFKKIPRKWTAIGVSLVPVEMLADFGLYQAGLGKYNDYNGQCCDFIPKFANRKTDGTLSFTAVSPKYKRFIKKPIRGEITFIGRKRIVKEWFYQGHFYSGTQGKSALIPVKIKVGRKQGVKKNMLFRLIGEPDYSQYLQITKVNEITSDGFIVREFTYEGKEAYYESESDKNKPFPPIKVGAKVSTSP